MPRTRTSSFIGALSVVAALIVMAVSAAAAQAGYQLLRNGSPVNLLALSGEVLLSELKVEEGLTIHCQGGSINAYLETAESGKRLIESGHTLYEGCSLLGAEKTCFISEESGAQDGHILFSFEGEPVSMTEEDTQLLALVEPSVIYIEGESCQITALPMVLEGALTLTISEAGTNLTNHLMGIEDEELFFGESPAFLSNEAHLHVEVGGTWAIGLT